MIIVGDDLKWTGHIDRMVGKGSKKVGMPKRTFVSRDLGLWKESKHFEEDIDKI